MIHLGLIKWFDPSKGFGVCITSDNKEVFLHIKNTNQADLIEKSPGRPIAFEIVNEKGKDAAKNWRSINQFEDVKSCLKVIECEITIPEVVSGKGPKGNPYRYTSDTKYKLFPEVLKAFWAGQPSEKIVDHYKHLFAYCSEDFPQHQNHLFRKVLSVVNQLPEINKASLISIIRKFYFGFLSYEELLSLVNSKELEIKEFLDLISQEKIIQYFTGSNDENRISILKELDLPIKEELMKIPLQEKDKTILSTIKFYQLYLGKVNNIYYQYIVREEFWNKEYWSDKKEYPIILEIVNHLLLKVDPIQLLDILFEGFIPKVPVEILHNNIKELDKNKISLLVENKNYSEDEKNDLILKWALINLKEAEWVFSIKKESVDFLKEFDEILFDSLTQEAYFHLWKKGYAKILPKDYLLHILQYGSKEEFDHAKEWLKKDLIEKETLLSLLLQIFQSFNKVNTRKNFYSLYYLIDFILFLDPSKIDQIKTGNRINEAFILLALWVQNKSEELQFEKFKNVFVFLSEAHQTNFIKKVFYYTHKGLFKITPAKLDELVRIDYELSREIIKENSEVLIDISSDIIINALVNFEEHGRFLMESDLLKIALKNLKNNPSYKFQVRSYFERCEGRMVPKFDGKTDGRTIEKIIYQNREAYAVSFEYDSTLVEQVKKISGRKYNSENKTWIIPVEGKTDLLEFAKNYRFFIHDGTHHYSNNPHLFNFKRTEVPNGIMYCDGRKANQVDNLFKKEFWFCTSQPCFQNCISDNRDGKEKSNTSNKDWDDLPF